MIRVLRLLSLACLSTVGVLSMVGQARGQAPQASSSAATPPPAPQAFSLQVPPLLAPATPPRSHAFGLHLLRLDPASMDPTRREEAMIGQPQGLTPGFLNLHIPDQITPASVGLELGIFAGKMMLLKSLCGFGRCRVNTGPGDLPMGWVEQFAEPGSAGHAPSQRLRSGR